jgi:peptide/nickel transport system substrate-binding protein
MRFHDSKPVTLEDLEFTFNYVLKWKFPPFSRVWKSVKSVEPLDKRTLRVHLNEPYAPFVSNVLGYMFIAPKHIWEKIPESTGLANPMDWPNPNPVGSGSFMFSEWKKGEYFHFKANKDHSFMAPEIDGIYCIVTPTREGMMAMLEKGDAEIMGSYVDGAQGDRLNALPHLTTISVSSPGMYEIRPNLALRPMSDPAFRAAFQLVIDRKTMLDVALGGKGVIASNTPIAPLMENWTNPKIEPFTFDLERAKKVLSQAGYTWNEKGQLCYPK